MELYKKIEYKNGYSINIYYDQDAQAPNELGDNGLFLTGFHRDFTPDQKFITKDRQLEIFEELAEPSTPDPDGYDDHDRAREWIKNYFIFPLFAYIHSGVTLSLGRSGQFADQWDSSTVGAVYIKKLPEYGDEKEAEKYALGLVEEWNQYLSGQVFGYMIESPDGNKEGGIWGFYGEPETSGLIVEAQAEADGIIEDQKKAEAAEAKKEAEDLPELLEYINAKMFSLTKRLNLHKKHKEIKAAIMRNVKSIQSIINKNL